MTKEQHPPSSADDQDGSTSSRDLEEATVEAARKLVDNNDGHTQDYAELKGRALAAANNALRDTEKLTNKAAELREKHGLSEQAAFPTGRGQRKPHLDRHIGIYANLGLDGSPGATLAYITAGQYTVLKVTTERAPNSEVNYLRVTNLTELEVARDGFNGYLGFAKIDADPSTQRAVAELGDEDLISRFSMTIAEGGTTVIGRSKLLDDKPISETADMGLSRQHLAMRLHVEESGRRIGVDIEDRSGNGTNFYPQPNTELFIGAPTS